MTGRWTVAIERGATCAYQVTVQSRETGWLQVTDLAELAEDGLGLRMASALQRVVWRGIEETAKAGKGAQ